MRQFCYRILTRENFLKSTPIKMMSQYSEQHSGYSSAVSTATASLGLHLSLISLLIVVIIFLSSP
jgi:hypothetical protein